MFCAKSTTVNQQPDTRICLLTLLKIKVSNLSTNGKTLHKVDYNNKKRQDMLGANVFCQYF